jgi:hypothetical protein
MSKSKSTLDKGLFSSFNNSTKTDAPVQTVVPIKPKKSETEVVGLFARIPTSLRKKIKAYSVEKEITQDALITEILQSYFQDK